VRVGALLCATLIPAGASAAVTYSFDWYCPGCAKLGLASNGREGSFGSGSACEGAEGNRLVGVVPIGKAIESEQSGRHCRTPPGEFPLEGRVSEGRSTIVWGSAQVPVGEGCAPVSISLGTWRRG
jgi:hypothetical protein